MDKIVIGIDPGQNTGFAVWDSFEKKFISLLTVSFWEAISLLQQAKTREDIGLCRLEVVVEDVTQNKPIFMKENRSKSGVKGFSRIASNVGMNKRDCQLLIQWCEVNGVKVVTVKPTKKSLTKLDAESFLKITKYSSSTSQHARDAGMLVFGR